MTWVIIIIVVILFGIQRSGLGHLYERIDDLESQISNLESKLESKVYNWNEDIDYYSE